MKPLTCCQPNGCSLAPAASPICASALSLSRLASPLPSSSLIPAKSRGYDKEKEPHPLLRRSLSTLYQLRSPANTGETGLRSITTSQVHSTEELDANHFRDIIQGRKAMLLLTPWSELLDHFQWPALVLFFSHLLYVKILIDVVRARRKHKIYAPATSGHPDFDRTFRVQQNFVEHYPSFLTGLCLCSLFINGKVAAVLGTVWVVFRYIQSENYRKHRMGMWILNYTVPQYAAIGLMYLSTVGRILYEFVRKHAS